MKPIEAMARALFSIANDDDEWTWEDYVEPARAALTALRDNGVTEGMVDAWVNAPVSLQIQVRDEYRMQAAGEFRAMLDAALNEAP